MSGQQPSAGEPSTRAIGSLAKKQSDVTRQGTQKLKFVPTLPARRKKEEIKPEPVAQPVPTVTNDRGRGRGVRSTRGKGRGASRPELEMTASGPFAMGPALAGNNARRSAPRSAFALAPTTSAPGASLAPTPAPSFQMPKLAAKIEKTEEDEAMYSDPDEGVEIVDMENVRHMDWMAPDGIVAETGQNDDIRELQDHAMHANGNKIYLFQFPAPFPEFLSMSQSSAETSTKRHVAFAPDVKPEPANTASDLSSADVKEHRPTDGVIGQLEIYRSGAVKMRLHGDMLLNVNVSTQPSFLQQAACIDTTEKQLIVLGEVNKRFNVSPDVETLLTAMEAADKAPVPGALDSEQLIGMDTT